MKLIAYELNEVPWRVIDLYVQLKPESALAEILKRAYQLTTVTHDHPEFNEIHPWTTWPTVHRGVYNDQHEIRFINQDILTQTTYPPIWEILAAHDYRVGVFGSLQSWPVPQNGPFAFYVPDTFAKDAQTYPPELGLFQAFNLEQTRRDSAISGKIKLSRYLGTLLKMLGQGLRLQTVMQLAQHLLNEKKNPDYKARRALMQAPLAFDFYWRLLNQTQPDFSTFFTNHVAGMMHRYWKYLFPEDFNYTLQTERDFFLAQNILCGMDIADAQIGRLMQFCDQQNYTLLIASSMGQHAVESGPYVGELRLQNPDQFLQKLGFAGRMQSFMAMQPDIAFRCDTAATLQEFQSCLDQITNDQGVPLFRAKMSGLSLNLYLGHFTEALIQNQVIYHQHQAVPIADFGIEVIHRDPGTGHHHPEGIALFYGTHIQPNAERRLVESIQLLPTILQAFQVPCAPYMAQPITGVIPSRLFSRLTATIRSEAK